ncbi:hypothetical protein [Leptolyngbya sp. FACHB-16]|uniref:hypothetical protein n=1 Tax=unclassified Leptolyngbya TaxID=2650499 RepID=UPI0016856B48|nr:hypothetical protein [Leptolyngbya sp. FACHB-16]MBD2158110.1 hypothetical protein [Leptolyngbya sp. FACHB-16]
MVRIKVVIEDEQGNILRQSEAQPLNLGQQTLHEIEGVVESWRQQVLPEIEAELLHQAQQKFTQDKKTQESSCAMEPER